MLEDLHSLAKCSLASTGLLCEQWNSTLGIRHSQFAYTIGGSILWSAGVSRGGAERLFFFRFMDSLENGAGEHFRLFIFSFYLYFSAVWKHQAQHTSKTDCQAFTGSTQKKANIIIIINGVNHTKPLLRVHFLLQRKQKVQKSVSPSTLKHGTDQLSLVFTDFFYWRIAMCQPASKPPPSGDLVQTEQPGAQRSQDSGDGCSY